MVRRCCNGYARKKKPVTTIVVVGHSSFMAEHIATLEKGKKKKPRNVGIVEIYFCLREIDGMKGYLYEVNQNTCGCSGIKTLQDEQSLGEKQTKRNQVKPCNGVIYRGIDFPEKKNLSSFSSDNCDRF